MRISASVLCGLLTVALLAACIGLPAGTMPPEIETPAATLPLAPTPLPAVLPMTAPVSAVPSGWQTYRDATLGVSFDYPADWELCQDTGQSRLFCRIVSSPEDAPLVPPALWVTLQPSGFTNEQATAYNFWSEAEVTAVLNTPVGQSIEMVHAPEGYRTYTRLADVRISGLPAAVVENKRVWEAGPDVKERRVLAPSEGGVHVVGAYYETAEELWTFEQVLASFRIGAYTAAPPAPLVDAALGGLIFARADGALVRRTFTTDEDVVLLPPGTYAAGGDASYMVPIGWPLRASADARWLLVPTPDQGTWLVSWDSQVQRQINAERLSATWAPDNQRIVFIYQTGAPPGRDNDVYLQDVVNGGDARLLTRLPQPVTYIFWSSACPGLNSGGADACAERIAAVTCDKDAPAVVCTVWLLDAGSAESRALGQFLPAPIGIAPINFGWAPSGAAFYVGTAADGPLAFPVDGSGSRPLVGNLPGLAQGQPAAYPPLSPDGARLAQLQPSTAKEGGRSLVIRDIRSDAAIHQREAYPDGAAIAGWMNDDVVLIKYMENSAQTLEGANIASGETRKLIYSDVFVGPWRQFMTRARRWAPSRGDLWINRRWDRPPTRSRRRMRPRSSRRYFPSTQPIRSANGKSWDSKDMRSTSGRLPGVAAGRRENRRQPPGGAGVGRGWERAERAPARRRHSVCGGHQAALPARGAGTDCGGTGVCAGARATRGTATRSGAALSPVPASKMGLASK